MKYLSITKPGIIFGNVITVTGAFFLGAHSIHKSFDGWLFVATLIGMSLVMACGCVLNNIIDRDIDQLMERTKERVMAQGLIPKSIAFLYGIMLGALGLFILFKHTNTLTALMALFGLLVYVVAYTILTKRHSVFGTAVGAIAGAIPPVVGYCAVTNQLNLGAYLVFLILFLWQIPHSYAIAIFRYNDYARARIPVLPVKTNIHATKLSMIFFTVLFVIATLLPTFFGYTGIIYFITALVMGIAWLFIAIKTFRSDNVRKWARHNFGISILFISILSFCMIF